LEEPLPEPDHAIIEKTEKAVKLKVTATADFARYDVETREIFFKPTLMYTSRTHTLRVTNTALTALKYNCKIVSYDEDDKAIVDPGFFYV